MIQTIVQLRYTPRVLRPVAGWFIASADSRHWMDEALRCFPSSAGQLSFDQSQIRFLPMPRSRHQRDAGGAVIVPALSGASEIPQMQATTRRVPYGRIGGRLFLPVEARLEPEVSGDELDALLSLGLTYVWHPTTGLVGFEAPDMLSIADLLQVPCPQPRRWNCACTGERLPPRLHRIAPLDPPAMEVVLRMGQDDIGSESNAISKLPPSSDEPKPGVSNAVKRTGLNILASGIQGLGFLARRVNLRSGQKDAGSRKLLSKGPSWVDRLTQWTQQRLDHFNQALQSEREKEIGRLMNLLETDPDRGLKYALPIGGDAHRGLGRPSAHLSERSTDFHLGRLDGGDAADPWELSWQEQQQLIARYRELANREMQLGRYRRAAYIFGELLADFTAAAGALKHGKHWRDASVLYRQRLNRHLDAARCLEQGGLWSEAVEAYVELEEHEKAGDIFTRLQQHDEAREQYRLAVAMARSRGDWLGAARLLEEKLDAVDDAIDELSIAWPHTGQAALCLERLFTLFGRLGRHDAAAEKIQQLRESNIPQRGQLPLIEIFASSARKYPDRAVQKLAADSTRVLASRVLVKEPDVDSTRILRAVRELAPEDRLLSRDCDRFERQQSLVAPPAIPKTRTSGNSPTLVRSICFPCPEGTWKAEAAITSGDAVFVAGWSGDGVLLVYRSTWTGEADEPLSWRTQNSVADLVLAANPRRADALLVHPVGGPLLASLKTFPETEDCPFETRVGAPPGNSLVIAASTTGHGITWLLEQRNGIVTLVVVKSDGQLLYSQALTGFEADLAPFRAECKPVPIFAGHRFHLGIGKKLIIFDGAALAKTVEFGRPIRSIVGSFPNTRNRVAVAFDQGGVVSWDDDWDGPVQRFATDLPAPLIAFSRGGLLVAAHDRLCEIYTTHANRVALKAELDLPSPAVAVLSAVLPNQFGVVLASGRINLYQMP